MITILSDYGMSSLPHTSKTSRHKKRPSRNEVLWAKPACNYIIDLWLATHRTKIHEVRHVESRISDKVLFLGNSDGVEPAARRKGKEEKNQDVRDRGEKFMCCDGGAREAWCGWVTPQSSRMRRCDLRVEKTGRVEAAFALPGKFSVALISADSLRSPSHTTAEQTHSMARSPSFCFF